MYIYAKNKPRSRFFKKSKMFKNMLLTVIVCLSWTPFGRLLGSLGSLWVSFWSLRSSLGLSWAPLGKKGAQSHQKVNQNGALDLPGRPERLRSVPRDPPRALKHRMYAYLRAPGASWGLLAPPWGFPRALGIRSHAKSLGPSKTIYIA